MEKLDDISDLREKIEGLNEAVKGLEETSSSQKLELQERDADIAAKST